MSFAVTGPTSFLTPSKTFGRQPSNEKNLGGIERNSTGNNLKASPLCHVRFHQDVVDQNERFLSELDRLNIRPDDSFNECKEKFKQKWVDFYEEKSNIKEVEENALTIVDITYFKEDLLAIDDFDKKVREIFDEIMELYFKDINVEILNAVKMNISDDIDQRFHTISTGVKNKLVDMLLRRITKQCDKETKKDFVSKFSFLLTNIADRIDQIILE